MSRIVSTTCFIVFICAGAVTMTDRSSAQQPQARSAAAPSSTVTTNQGGSAAATQAVSAISASAPATQATVAWQTEVAAFITALQKAGAESAAAHGGRADLEELNSQFAEKRISWRGELKYVRSARPYFRNTFVVTGPGESQSVASFFPPVGQESTWDAVKPGTSVAFTGRIVRVNSTAGHGGAFFWAEVGETLPVLSATAIAASAPTTKP